MSKPKDKYLALRRQLPDIIDEYIFYLQVDVEEPSPKMVERLSVIQKFLAMQLRLIKRLFPYH